MIYDPSKIMYDQQIATDATKLFDDVTSFIASLPSNASSKEILKEISILKPSKTTILDTINLVLGWLTFPKEDDHNKATYRTVIDFLSQYLAGVE